MNNIQLVAKDIRIVIVNDLATKQKLDVLNDVYQVHGGLYMLDINTHYLSDVELGIAYQMACINVSDEAWNAACEVINNMEYDPYSLLLYKAYSNNKLSAYLSIFGIEIAEELCEQVYDAVKLMEKYA